MKTSHFSLHQTSLPWKCCSCRNKISPYFNGLWTVRSRKNIFLKHYHNNKLLQSREANADICHVLKTFVQVHLQINSQLFLFRRMYCQKFPASNTSFMWIIRLSINQTTLKGWRFITCKQWKNLEPNQRTVSSPSETLFNNPVMLIYLLIWFDWIGLRVTHNN